MVLFVIQIDKIYTCEFFNIFQKLTRACFSKITFKR